MASPARGRPAAPPAAAAPQIGEGPNAVYVHVASLHDHPKFFKSQADFDRYLRETGKEVLSNDSVELSDPDAAYREFAKLTADKWWWKVLPDNRATFAVAIIGAGGGNFGVRLNCPNQAFVQSLGRRPCRGRFIW